VGITEFLAGSYIKLINSAPFYLFINYLRQILYFLKDVPQV